MITILMIIAMMMVTTLNNVDDDGDRPLLPRMIMIVIMVKNMTLVMVTSDHGLLLHLLRITEQVQS